MNTLVNKFNAVINYASATLIERDEVMLSSIAKDIQLARKNMVDIPADHLQHIENIRQKISQGNYHVDAIAIAKKMVEKFK